jgi:hypothetical protein
MWRKIIIAAGLGAAFVVPSGVEANHGGCLANSVAPQCQYTAIAGHSCTGYTESTWEASVIRRVQVRPGVFENRKVVLASGEGTVVAEAVPAIAGERVTLTLNADGTGGRPNGLLSCGNTAGHP